MKIIDLTHTMNYDMPVFPGTERPVFLDANTIEKDGFKETKFCMYSHTGTHIDAPSHMLKAAISLYEMKIEQFVGEGIILDCTNINKDKIEVIDIIKYEEKLSDIDFVIIKTGWSKYWGEEKYFDKFPYISKETADWLISFGLKGIGIDTISIDDIETNDFAIHYKLFEKNIIIIENLTNLDNIEESFIFSCLPIKYKNADGSPVRAIAMINSEIEKSGF